MVALVSNDALDDLRDEDPVAAVEAHFEPVKVQRLPEFSINTDDCSVDGYYEQFVDPAHPQIIYSDEGGLARARFTIVHELGHHILNTEGIGDHLLDDLDRIAGPTGNPSQAEESACHRFAGEVLVPSHLLESVIGSDQLCPKHLLELHEQTNASWEALAVRTADHSSIRTVVALVRHRGEVAFAAANWLTSWRRGCQVKPRGPLDRALQSNSTARSEVFRYGLGGAESMFCDTLQVHDHLAVAVMSSRRSSPGLSFLETVEPAWKEKEELCPWCNEERDVGWCDNCSGRKCRSCGRCGCQTPLSNPACPLCHQVGPFRDGAQICRDCEADGLDLPVADDNR